MTVSVAACSEECIILLREKPAVPIDQMVGAGLRQADEAKMTKVTVLLMPADGRLNDILMDVLRAILIFKHLGPQSVVNISILTPQKPAAAKYLNDELERAAEAELQNRPGYIAK